MKVYKYILLTVLCFVASAVKINAQQRISGQVSDELGPLMMVNVVEVDKDGRFINHATTDFDGNFTMIVKNNKNKLKITYVGFKDELLEIGDRTVFNDLPADAPVGRIGKAGHFGIEQLNRGVAFCFGGRCGVGCAVRCFLLAAGTQHGAKNQQYSQDIHADGHGIDLPGASSAAASAATAVVLDDAVRAKSGQRQQCYGENDKQHGPKAGPGIRLISTTCQQCGNTAQQDRKLCIFHKQTSLVLICQVYHLQPAGCHIVGRQPGAACIRYSSGRLGK